MAEFAHLPNSAKSPVVSWVWNPFSTDSSRNLVISLKKIISENMEQAHRCKMYHIHSVFPSQSLSPLFVQIEKTENCFLFHFLCVEETSMSSGTEHEMIAIVRLLYHKKCLKEHIKGLCRSPWGWGDQTEMVLYWGYFRAHSWPSIKHDNVLFTNFTTAAWGNTVSHTILNRQTRAATMPFWYPLCSSQFLCHPVCAICLNHLIYNKPVGYAMHWGFLESYKSHTRLYIHTMLERKKTPDI